MGTHIRKSKQCVFFTIPKIAKLLIDSIDLSKFELIIEPSAGNGSFSRQIDNCIAFDVDPKHPSIEKRDFLKEGYQTEIDRKNILCIGNPPFGTNGSLALAFIRKCSEIADTIAFILPLSYKKDSIQARIPNGYHLVQQLDIPLENALLNGETQKVPVVFQVWENRGYPREIPTQYAPLGFSYVKRDDAHFCVRRVGMRAGRASRDLSPSTTAHYYIRLHDEALIDRTLEYLNGVEWEHNNTVGQRSISKNELNKVMIEVAASSHGQANAPSSIRIIHAPLLPAQDR
jgi:predicted RNA methylase